MTEEDTTIGAAASLIGCTLRDYGISVTDVFRDAGLDPEAAIAADVRYPFEKMQRMWRLAVERSGDPCFGLAVAGHIQPQALHGLGFMWLSSDTLLDALERLVKYQRMISTVADIRLEEQKESVQLHVDFRRSTADIEYASLDAAVGVFVNMCRIATCETFNPVRLSLERPRPDCAERFEDLFRSPVEFGAAANIIDFDPVQLREPLPGANPELARANDQVVIDYLGRFDRENISMQVRSRLIELLPGGQPSQKDIAGSLNLSVRNLQRRLQAEGISFKRLLDDTRKDLAAQYIRDSHRRIGEITYLLGFSEPSNFTRAFRRWTGVSPNEFRQRS
ncbi:MAG TPA: AraC family transcriptional regulator [Gammaproteobacteria bacterium]|nr:AraC family transcriptional regulator [Gammaproteobacteria bacterium]